MSDRPTTLERAFELARTGGFTGITQIKARLKEEGYAAVEAQLYGQKIRRDLRRLCDEARAAVGPGQQA